MWKFPSISLDVYVYSPSFFNFEFDQCNYCILVRFLATRTRLNVSWRVYPNRFVPKILLCDTTSTPVSENEDAIINNLVVDQPYLRSTALFHLCS